MKTKSKKRQRHANGNAPNGDASNEDLSRKDYEKQLDRLHGELVHLQQWVVKEGLKVIVVFEGRDGAGKGGVIKAITERVSPRVYQVVALPAPSDREKTQLYLQRYLTHFPAGGEIVIFDRSWYNRAGVERVLEFTDEKTCKQFLQIIPLFEKAIVASGVKLIKYWLEVSPEEQTRRLEDRIDDPRKVWKLSPMDLKSYGRWFDYSRARDEMFQATDTPFAPWYVVRSDQKRKARLNLITHLLDQIPYKKLPREKVKLPKRDKRGKYREPDYPFKYIKETH